MSIELKEEQALWPLLIARLHALPGETELLAFEFEGVGVAIQMELARLREELRAALAARSEAPAPVWRKLLDDDGLPSVECGQEYLFALQVSKNGATPAWQYFVGAVDWDEDTDADWSNGDCGWSVGVDIWFTPLPSPPVAPELGKVERSE